MNIGSEGIFWSVYGKCEPEISMEQFISALEDSLKEGTFFQLPNKDQHKIIALELHYNGQKEITGEVRDEAVEDRIVQLREQYGKTVV